MLFWWWGGGCMQTAMLWLWDTHSVMTAPAFHEPTWLKSLKWVKPWGFLLRSLTPMPVVIITVTDTWICWHWQCFKLLLQLLIPQFGVLVQSMTPMQEVITASIESVQGLLLHPQIPILGVISVSTDTNAERFYCGQGHQCWEIRLLYYCHWYSHFPFSVCCNIKYSRIKILMQ